MAEIEITFLGTAASVPSVERGLSALIVRFGNQRFLVDCGEGTQRQLMRSGIGFRGLDKVLLTHGHLDHLLGLGGFAGTVNLWRTADRLTVYAGRHALHLAETLLRKITWPEGEPALDLAFIPLVPGEIWSDRQFRVTAFPVRHRAPDCFGFLFEEKPRRPLLAERLSELGVPEGPERMRLAGNESIVLDDGRRIDPDDVLGPLRSGTRLAVVGDTGSTTDLVEHVSGADALVIEATFLKADTDKALARGHLTAEGAARLAAEAKVGALFLAHLSSRYSTEDIEAEARAIFPNTRVANDLDRLSIG